MHELYYLSPTVYNTVITSTEHSETSTTMLAFLLAMSVATLATGQDTYHCPDRWYWQGTMAVKMIIIHLSICLRNTMEWDTASSLAPNRSPRMMPIFFVDFMVWQ